MFVLFLITVAVQAFFTGYLIARAGFSIYKQPVTTVTLVTANTALIAALVWFVAQIPK